MVGSHSFEPHCFFSVTYYFFSVSCCFVVILGRFKNNNNSNNNREQQQQQMRQCLPPGAALEPRDAEALRNTRVQPSAVSAVFVV